MAGKTSGEGVRGIRERGVLPALLWGLVLLSLISGCGGKEQDPEQYPPVATVNGEAISREVFLEKLGRELALFPNTGRPAGQEREDFKKEVLAGLIEERLIIQRARAMRLAVEKAELEAQIAEISKDYNPEEFKALFGEHGFDYQSWRESLRVRLLLDKVIAADVNTRIVVDDAEAEQRYLANPKAYVSGEERLRVQQIVVRERKEAENVLKRLNAGEDFGKIAREVSIGPEGRRDGDLGWTERGVMPGGIDRVIFSLDGGELSRVVESPYGFHIFKILDREKKGERTFADAEVRTRVIADLRKQKEDEAYRRWIEDLSGMAVTEIRLPLPDLPVSPAPRRGGSPEGSEKQ